MDIKEGADSELFRTGNLGTDFSEGMKEKVKLRCGLTYWVPKGTFTEAIEKVG